MLQMIECVGGFADGRKFEGFEESEMILFHSKDGIHLEQRYVERGGVWWAESLFDRLDIMNNYDWNINEDM
mgnify:FL=1